MRLTRSSVRCALATCIPPALLDQMPKHVALGYMFGSPPRRVQCVPTPTPHQITSAIWSAFELSLGNPTRYSSTGSSFADFPGKLGALRKFAVGLPSSTRLHPQPPNWPIVTTRAPRVPAPIRPAPQSSMHCSRRGLVAPDLWGSNHAGKQRAPYRRRATWSANQLDTLLPAPGGHAVAHCVKWLTVIRTIAPRIAAAALSRGGLRPNRRAHALEFGTIGSRAAGFRCHQRNLH